MKGEKPQSLAHRFPFLSQAFNKCKREGFRLQTVDKAPLAKRRKMKKTSTSTETRSSSSESTHSSSSSSQSQEKTFPGGDANLQPSNSTPVNTPVNTPVALGTESERGPAHAAFDFSEGQWHNGRKKRSRNVMNRRMARTSVETAPLSFSLTLAPLCLRLNCMDICTSPKPSMQQEQQPSPQYQSIITSNSLSLLSLSLSHSQTDCSNQGLDQDELLLVSKLKKGCPTAPGPDRQWRDVCSLVITSQLSLSTPFFCLCPHVRRF